jgi:hypothetical protein
MVLIKEAIVEEQPQPEVKMVKPNQAAVLPPLENGDRLTRREFERRYQAMPHLKKAEVQRGLATPHNT